MEISKILQRSEEERNILQTIERRKDNWTGHILHNNCLLKHVIEGKIDEMKEVKEDEEEDVSSYWMTLRQRFLIYNKQQCSVKHNIHIINPLNAELNPICHLLALLGAHHILHVSRIGVNIFIDLGLHVSIR